VAVVEGRCLAGGCGLATVCDIVLCEVGLAVVIRDQPGFVPAMVMTMLRRLVGERLRSTWRRQGG